jgi:trimethylamine--corrinoid protein Co-methyltransferase
MARLYKLPCFTAPIGSLTQMGRGDISADFGSLENAESAALEQVILDVEEWEQAKAYLRRFRINEETLGFDAIKNVGPGGNFLGTKHTLEHFQEEIWLKKETTILPSTDGSIIDRAKAKVRQILASHVPPQLDEEVKNKMSQILHECKKDISG